MDEDTLIYAAFAGFVILVVFLSVLVFMQGCSFAPRMTERVSIMQECGYPSNPHEAKVFHECIEARYESMGD